MVFLTKRTKSELMNYLHEVEDRVWYLRSNIRPETTGIQEDIKARALAEKKRIEQEYDWSDYSWTDDNGEIHILTYEKDYRRLEGAMAALRWVLGEDEKDNYDT